MEEQKPTNVELDKDLIKNFNVTNGIISLDQNSILNAGLSLDDKYKPHTIYKI